MKSIYARLTFSEELLGTASGDPEVHESFIASKAPDALSVAEEVESIGVDAVVKEKVPSSPATRMAVSTFGTTRSRECSRQPVERCALSRNPARVRMMVTLRALPRKRSPLHMRVARLLITSRRLILLYMYSLARSCSIFLRMVLLAVAKGLFGLRLLRVIG